MLRHSPQPIHSRCSRRRIVSRGSAPGAPPSACYAKLRSSSPRGDQRNALYAEISVLRGQLPRLPVPEVSARLAEYLEDPVVQADDRLRLRCLVIKGETDQDLDPSLAGESWREAQALAEKLGDAAWANRASGELGLVAFLQGDIGASVIGLGQALKVAQSNGDVSSLVRWLTLFGTDMSSSDAHRRRWTSTTGR